MSMLCDWENAETIGEAQRIIEDRAPKDTKFSKSASLKPHNDSIKDDRLEAFVIAVKQEINAHKLDPLHDRKSIRDVSTQIADQADNLAAEVYLRLG